MEMNDLPPEYLAEIQRLQRQRKMAEALQMQGMQGGNRPTEMISGHAIRQSPLAALAPVLQMYLGTKMGGKAEEGLGEVQQRAATASQTESGDLATLFQTDPKAAIVKALAAKFSQNRKLGEDWGKQYQDRVNQWSNATKDTDPTASADAIASQTLPGQWSPPPIPSPEFGTSPTGKPYAVDTNRKGEKTLKFEPEGTKVTTNVTNKIPGMEGQAVLDSLQQDLKLRRERAQIAKESIAHNKTAREALVNGAQAGGGEELKQGIRKVAQAFGIEAPATAPTEQLQMSLGNAILASARALAPVTGEDVKRLERIKGSINTDPTALVQMLDIYDNLAVKELETFNEYVNHQSKNLETPYARDLFKGQAIGFTVPKIEPGLVNVPAVQNHQAPAEPISLDDYLKRQKGGK
jgi:hypothetical protein